MFATLFSLGILFRTAPPVVYMTSHVAGASSNLPVSDPADPDGVEDTTLGNISTEAQVNFGSEVTVLHYQ